jgi:hypothetical protein
LGRGLLVPPAPKLEKNLLTRQLSGIGFSQQLNEHLILGDQMKFKISAFIVVAVLSVSGSFVAVANPVTTTTNPAGMAVDPSFLLTLA